LKKRAAMESALRHAEARRKKHVVVEEEKKEEEKAEPVSY